MAKLFVGTTDSQAADGSNATHLVTDTDAWVARCGKSIAEAREGTLEEVTCRTCARD